MTSKDLLKMTKAEIVYLYQEKQKKFNELLEQQSKMRISYEHKINDLSNEKENMSKTHKMQKIENLSELKSMKSMLLPFSSETMTHREKAYLSRKFENILDMKIKSKMEELYNEFYYNGNLPF